MWHCFFFFWYKLVQTQKRNRNQVKKHVSIWWEQELGKLYMYMYNSKLPSQMFPDRFLIGPCWLFLKSCFRYFYRPKLICAANETTHLISRLRGRNQCAPPRFPFLSFWNTFFEMLSGREFLCTFHLTIQSSQLVAHFTPDSIRDILQSRLKGHISSKSSGFELLGPSEVMALPPKIRGLGVQSQHFWQENTPTDQWESSLELFGPLHPTSGCKAPKSTNSLNLEFYIPTVSVYVTSLPCSEVGSSAPTMRLAWAQPTDRSFWIRHWTT